MDIDEFFELRDEVEDALIPRVGLSDPITLGETLQFQQLVTDTTATYLEYCHEEMEEEN